MATTNISVQDLLGIEECVDGIIKTKDNRYVTIVEVSPINFNYKDAEEKAVIIDRFARWLKIAPAKIHFKTLSKRSDVRSYINVLSQKQKQPENAGCYDLYNHYMNLIDDLSTRRGITQRYFMIFELDSKQFINASHDDIYYAFSKIIDTASTYLQKIGNIVKANMTKAQRNQFVIETLYAFLNRDHKVSDIQNKISEIVDNATEYYREKSEQPETLNIPFLDIIAPPSIEFSSSYVKIGDLYYTYLVFPSESLYERVRAAWLSAIVACDEGVDVDIFASKQDSKSIKSKVRRRIRINNARLNSMEELGDDFENTSSAISSGYFIREKLSEGESFYYMNVMLTISAYSFEELDEKVTQIEEWLESIDMPARQIKYKMKDAFSSTLPLCKLDSYIYGISKRNVTTSGLASTYLFTSSEMFDDNGVLLGINRDNSSLCIIDNFNTSEFANANMSILGSSGAGKTFLLQLLALRYRMMGIQTFIIAPLKGSEFKRACHAVGGQFIDISVGSPHRINILDIRPVDNTNDMLIDGDAYNGNEVSQLLRKLDDIRPFFNFAIPNMSELDKEYLDSALFETYHRKGITKNNLSLIKERRKRKVDGKTVLVDVYKEMPVLRDLYDVLLGNPKTEHLALRLNSYVNGSASIFNGQTNVDLSNKYIVFDVSNLSADLLKVGMFVALNFVSSQAKADRTKKKAIIIDEAWHLLCEKTSAEHVKDLFKTIRGYGGAAISATQDIGDFFALENGVYGKAVINNSKIKFLLKIDTKEEAETIQSILGLTENELDTLKKLQRGEGIILANSNTFNANFIASQKEVELITTDRKLLEQIAQRNQQKSREGDI